MGGIGVTVFFVISGYLITGILISYADALPLKKAAKKFYWRRCLRLLPIYYICIAVTAILGLGGMRQTWLINALYLTNFKVAFDGAWNGSSHFWSLAVEEQFYLVWFAIVVILPRRFLLPSIVLSIFGAVSFRLLTYALGTNELFDTLLPGCMDSLAAGALMAYWKPPGGDNLARFRIPIGLLSLLIVISLQGISRDIGQRVFIRCFLNIMSVCLVSLAIDQTTDWRIDWLKSKPLVHIGKISYGLYVYHFFLPPIIDKHIGFEWIPSWTGGQIVRLMVLSIVSLAIAEVSWNLIEKPIMKLKQRAN